MKTNESSEQEGHDGPGITHLRVIALMPHFFLQLKQKTFQWFYQLTGHELVENEKRNILVKLIS